MKKEEDYEIITRKIWRIYDDDDDEGEKKEM